jgi:LCP family protein required for cell wall assembly
MTKIDSPNLLAERIPNVSTPSPTRPLPRRILRIVRTISIVVVVVFLVLAWTTRSSNPNVILAIRDSAAIRSLRSLLRSPSSMLRGEAEDRITFLLLGMGGEGHEGPLLTDTILIATIQPRAKSATLISIPRDLLIPIPDGRYEKVNAINAYAERGNGEGAVAVREALASVLDLEIPYHARVDFQGFAGLIDAIGGVTIDVERTLDDPQYPIQGMESAPWRERFEHLVIPAGRQYMDGTLALKYVRSRHALGSEGSDFARARRQQRLLVAVRDRVLSRGLLANPRSLLALLTTWRNHVATNLSPPELLRLSTFVPLITGEDATRVVFSDEPNGELVAARWGGAYVLRPKDGTFAQIRGIIHSAFTSEAVPGAFSAARASGTVPLTVEIWNGTTVTGLAADTAASLTRDGFSVIAVRNAPSRTVERTIVYYDQQAVDSRQQVAIRSAVERLAQQLKAEVSTAFPAVNTLNGGDRPDILVVLGASSVVTQAVK